MPHEQRIKPINDSLLEWIETSAVAHLPSQYLGASQRIGSHIALAFQVQLDEPLPHIFELGRQLWRGRRLGHSIRRILPSCIGKMGAMYTSATRCWTRGMPSQCQGCWMRLTWPTWAAPGRYLKMNRSDVSDGTIELLQNKTRKKLRVKIDG